MEMTMNTVIALSPKDRLNAIRQVKRAQHFTFKELKRADRAKQKGRLEQIHECLDHITRLDTFLVELGA